MNILSFRRHTLRVGKKALAGLALAILSAAMPAAYADMLMIGNSGGEVFGRDEYNLSAHISSSYITFGGSIPVASLAAGPGGNVAIGIGNYQPNVSVRNYATLSAVISSISSGPYTVGAMAAGSANQLAFGDSNNNVFLRDITNLSAYPAGYVGTDGLNFNAPIAGLGILPGGNVVVGNANGEIFIRSGTNLSNVPVGAASGYVNYGTPLSSLTVTDTGFIVLGFQSGLVDVRAWEDLAVSLTSVNFGLDITALTAMNNGTVAIGLANGQVSLRPISDVQDNIQTTDFTGGAGAVTALALSSDGNLGVGTGNNLVFIRQGTDLTQVPVGFVGPDGLNFNAPVTALNFASSAVPEPGTVVLVGLALAGGLMVARSRRRAAC